MIKKIVIVGLLLMPLWFGGSPSIEAANPAVGAKGLCCWVPNTEIDLAGYRLYITNPANVMTMIDALKPTTALPNPNPAGKPCAAGTIGIVRDQTGQADGTYSDTITAYDQVGNESTKASPYVYPLDQTPPAPVTGGVVAQ